MTLKQFRKNRIVKAFSNRYILIFTIFIVWMTFFDENSFLINREFNKEIEKLEADKKYYQTEIFNDKKKIKKLENPEKLDKFAREKYHMKKENEDVYIIEFDTLQ